MDVPMSIAKEVHKPDIDLGTNRDILENMHLKELNLLAEYVSRWET
jgi:hypothetical protein